MPFHALTFVLLLVCLPAEGLAPSIAIQPASQIVRNGETVRFAVVAEGEPPLSYQWRLNEAQLVNATSAELILSNVQPSQAGIYSVVVSNAAGSNASNDALLQVCWEAQQVSFEQISNAPVGWRLKFDSVGNYFLGQYTEGEVAFSLLKFTPSHQQAFEIRPVPAPGIGYFSLNDFAIDNAGNVYMVGVAATNYYSDREEIVVWKFDPEGAELWSNRYESAGVAHGIAVEPTGNVIVVRTTSEGFNSRGGRKPPGDIELVKFSPSGQRLWTVTYDGPGHDTTDLGPVAVDGNGNAYFAVTAYGTGGSSFDPELVVIKYDGAGVKQWIARRAGYQMYPPNSLLADRAGNIVVGISMWHGAPLDTHETVKFNSEGDLLWAIQHTVDSDIQATGARALDESNNIYFAIIQFFDHKLILTKYDPEGRELWSLEHNPEEPWSSYPEGALRVGPDNKVSFAAYGGMWPMTTLNFAGFLQNTTDGRPTIHGAQSQTRRVASGTTVQLDVAATGAAPLYYQWRRNGLDLPDTTEATLVLTNVTTAASGKYSVLVANSVGCAVSPDVQLVVVDVPPFRFEQIQVTSNTISFTLTVGGWLYWIETSTNLIDWSPRFGYGGGPTVISKGNQPQLFLRARTTP